MFKLVRTDVDVKTYSTTVVTGVHEFGRGVFLDCKDKKVSRRHGQLAVSEDNKIILTALNKNPCFVTAKDSPALIVLSKGMTRELREGDEFGLLPDSFWYRVTKNEDSDAACEERTEADVEEMDSSSPLGTDIKTEIRNVDVAVEEGEQSNSTSGDEMSEQVSSPPHTKRTHLSELQSEPSSSKAKRPRISTESLQVDAESPIQEEKKLSSATHGDGAADLVSASVPSSSSQDVGVVSHAGTSMAQKRRGAKRGRLARRKGRGRGALCGAMSSRRRDGPGTVPACEEQLPGDCSVLGTELFQANTIKQEMAEQPRVSQVSTARSQLLMGAPDETTNQASGSQIVPTAMRVPRTTRGSLRVERGGEVLLEHSPGVGVRCWTAPFDPENFWIPEDCQRGGSFVDAAPSDGETKPLVEDLEVAAAEEGDVLCMDVGVDEGSEFSNTDDEEWQPTSKTINAGQIDQDVEPEISEILSKFQDAVDDEVLPSAGSAFTWGPDYSTFTGSQEVFSGTPGPTIPCDTPYESFCEIWDQEIMNTIVLETNRYAWQTIVEETEKGGPSKDSRLHRWYETTVDEMYVLFAIFMLMAIDPRSRLEEYWRKGTVLEMPRFQKLMTYNRYLSLTKFLHFVDNYEVKASGKDRKVAKLQPIIDHCNKKFQSCYVPHQYIAVDESLTLWKGHLSWVQNIMTKAARFGIKTYELCESHTGYLWKFIVYTGKTCNIATTTELNPSLLGKTSQIVLDMVQDLHHKGYCLTMDNFYNSPALARQLKTYGIDCIGTLRTSHKNVPDAIKKLTDKTMAGGAVVARHCGDLSVQTWKDAKLVTTISTFHDDSMYLGRRGNRLQMKPVVIRDYNRTMGGVDLKDQKLSMYLLERKRTHKWYIKMFKRLLNASILNSFVMHHYTKLSKHEQPLEHREYRHQLANEIIDRHHKAAPVNVASISCDHRLDGSGHFMFLNVKTCGKCISLDARLRDCDKCKQCEVKRRRCARCSALGKRSNTKFHCKKCDKGLCSGRCFLEYHEVEDLSK